MSRSTACFVIVVAATLPGVLAMAELGVRGALDADPHLRAGLNVYAGQLTCRGVADSLGIEFVDPAVALAR